MKFIGKLKQIKILGILGKKFENFLKNFSFFIIIKLIQFQYNLLKF